MCLRIKANNRKGYSLVREGGVFDISYVTSRTRRGRVQGNMGGGIPGSDRCVKREYSIYRVY